LERSSLASQLEALKTELSSDLKQSLQTAKKEQEEVREAADTLIEQISEPTKPKLTSELFDTLEQEALVLREEKLKLEEQVTLLEKSAVNSAQDRQQLHETVKSLRVQLRGMGAGDRESSIDTYDTELSSVSSNQPESHSALHIGQDAVDKEMATLRAALEKQQAALSNAEMDWTMERESLEEVVTSLRQKTQKQDQELASLKSEKSWSAPSAADDTALQAEIDSLKEEKTDLEAALEELDSQHSAALDQLISQRDKLQSDCSNMNTEHAKILAEREKLEAELQQQKEQIQILNQTLETALENKEADEKCNSLTAELNELKNSTARTQKQQLDEIADLKEKLQKGGLVVNDLHMDKQELQEELTKAKEEVARKVDSLKELREENGRLKDEMQTLQETKNTMADQLKEMEEEMERWQQVNEDVQVKNMEVGKREKEDILKQLDLSRNEKQFFVEKMKYLMDSKTSDVGDCSSLNDEDLLKILHEVVKVHNERENDKQAVCGLSEELEKLKSEMVSEGEKRQAVDMAFKKVESDLEICKSQKETLLKEKLELENILKDLSREKEELKQANEILEETQQSQKKNFDNYVKELQNGRELESESLQSEHEKLLDLQRQNLVEIDSLKKEKEILEAQLEEKETKIKSLTENLMTFSNEMKEEIGRLEKVCEEKDHQIEGMKSQLNQFGTDLNDIERSVSVAEDKHLLELSGKEEQLQQLKEQNLGLERTLSQTQEVLKGEISRSQSQQDMIDYQDSSTESQLKEVISNLKIQQALSEENLVKLNEDLSSAHQTIQCHEFGIAHLNEKSEEHQKEMEKADQEIRQHKNDLAVLRQALHDKESTLHECHSKLDYILNHLTPDQVEKLETFIKNPAVIPAIEFKEHKAIENGQAESSNAIENEKMQSGSTEEGVSEDRTEIDKKRFDLYEKEMSDLKERLKEKDDVVSELQKSNSSLLGLLEGKSGNKELNSQVVTHKLEAEIRSLNAERESIVAVVSEKSRENSNLKAEVHRLMEVVSAGQAALTKLQEDNKEMEQRQNQKQKSPSRGHEDEEDDMRREALGNMARLVRDREVEIEALNQKIETLMAVLQDSANESQAAAHLGPLLKEKEELQQQVANMSTEREQLVTCLTQKHTEVVTYYTETQRLTGLFSSIQEEANKVKSEYQSLIPSFEDKSRSLVNAQAEIVELKQKVKDLEVRHGELLQRYNNQDNNQVNADPTALQADLEKLRHSEADLKASLAKRDEKVQSLTHRVNTLEEDLNSKETESTHLRKQSESAKFQLTGLMAELADLKNEREQMQQKTSAQDTESNSLRESTQQLTLEMRQKDMEVSALREQVASLNRLLQEQQGEQGQAAQQLIQEKESILTSARQIQQERDQYHMAAQQRQQDCNSLRQEMQGMKDKEFKLTKELERLRAHLIEMEDSYTQEALDSEEREKELRNRLSVAEEYVSTSSSQVEQATQESSRQIQCLEQQLTQYASQRDSAYLQVAQIQEQCQQYASSLGNLQLVLEHFQKEKDSAIAAETERYQEETRRLKTKVIEMTSELDVVRGDLAEALDGLEAASRLSEQLDKKEEALRALKEEVQLRETALSTAELEIQKLNSSKEAKVDKVLMHNMVMTWLTSPENKRMEIVNLIGNVLSFSADDFKKIKDAQNQGGLLSSIFRRPPETPAPDQSFSSMFVKFLQEESSPAPPPMRLPVEEMAAEAALRHKQPGFNPFTAPRHVTTDGSNNTSQPSSFLFPTSSNSQSNLLMSSHDGPTSPLFAPLTSTTNHGESAILKDVLGKR